MENNKAALKGGVSDSGFSMSRSSALRTSSPNDSDWAFNHCRWSTRTRTVMGTVSPGLSGAGVERRFANSFGLGRVLRPMFFDKKIGAVSHDTPVWITVY